MQLNAIKFSFLRQILELVTFYREESISHSGSPFRLAILDSLEEAKIVLLDHIPHSKQIV